MKERDIYNLENRESSAIRRLKNDPKISNKNKKLILAFYRDLKLDSIGDWMRLSYLIRATAIAKHLEKDLSEMDKTDMKNLIIELKDTKYKGKSYSEETIRKNMVTLKKFYKWLRDTEDYPPEVSWIKTSNGYAKSKKPEDLITDEEFENLLKHCKNSRDKAIIWVLWESGCRIGELLTMRVKDIKFDSMGAVMHISGKTGFRRVRLVKSVPALSSYLNNHSSDDKAPLWISDRGLSMNHAIFRRMLSDLKERSGFKKRLHAHLFRHTAATRLASQLTEQQLKNYLGWAQGSNMAAVYVSLSGKDMDDAILQMNGKIAPKEETNGKYLPKRCNICNIDNEYNSDWCSQCRHPISEKSKQESLNKEQMMIQTLLPSLNELVRNEMERMKAN